MASDTGVARHIDHLGRIVIPIELRRTFDIQAGDALGISTEGDSIVLRKMERSCVFCRGTDRLRPFRDRLVCESCLQDLTKQSAEAAPEAPSQPYAPTSSGFGSAASGYGASSPY
jgi:transcriptional pleiotropic regulator of transition state genes